MRLLISFIGVITALILPARAHAAPITIKYSHVVAEDTPKGQAALAFKACVEKRLPGQAEVMVYPNSQLFSDTKVLEALLLGDVQIATPALSKFAKYTKKLQLFDLPFLFDDLAAVDRFQNSPQGQSLLSSMETKGIHGLGFQHSGMKQMSAHKPLHWPQDAKGLKFRIMNSDVLAAQFEAVGATPIKKPFSEMFLLLQTRAIDGAENPWTNIWTQKLQEVQDYFTETNHGILDYMVVTSSEFWNSLPGQTRTVLQDCVGDASALAKQLAWKQAVEYRSRVIDTGAKVVPLTDEQRRAWKKAMMPVWKQFESDIGADLIAAAKAANHQGNVAPTH